MKWALLGVLLAACNQVFDLKPTRSIDAGVGADVDGDGVGDAVDNCPTLKNPDQANTDGDAFGDACDSCPALASLSTHDEDRDRLGDDCDRCPGTPDFSVDEDGDGVGDLCDPITDKLALPDHRVVFEPFVTMPAGWQPDVVPWSQASDTISPNIDLGPTDRLRNTAITTPTTWSAEIGLESHSHWEKADTYSIRAENASNTIDCSVKCSSNGTTTYCVGYVSRNSVVAISIAVIPQPTTSIAIVVKGVATPYCVFSNGYPFAAGTTPMDGMRLSITASPRVHASYFDYIE